MNIKIALAQIYPRLGDLNSNLDLFRKKINEAIQEKAQLIVFPELGLTGYFLRDIVPSAAIQEKSKIFQELLKLSKKISICFGYVEETASVEFYNAGIYLEDGEIKHIHRKVYLPTYGMFDEQRYFSRGNTLRSFDTKLGRMAMLICEDLWHPTSLQVAVQDGAKIILALSSSPGRGVGEGEKLYSTEMWEAMNSFYASLWGAYIVFVNRAGVEDGINFWGGSEVVDPKGEAIAKAPYFDEALIYADIDEGAIRRSRVASPILRDENLDLVIRELTRIKDEHTGNQPGARRKNARPVPRRRNR